MHSVPVKASFTKLSMELPQVQRKVDGYFFPENDKSSPPKTTPVFQTNRIAAFLGIGELLNSTP